MEYNTLLASGGYARVYCTDDRQYVKKIQPITTTVDESKLLQYSTLVDLVIHESLSTIPGLPFLMRHEQNDDNIELYMPNYGKPLNSALRFVPEHERQNFAIQVLLSLVTTCMQLQHNGLQHTDLKPSNILVSSRNDVTIIDFNIVSSMYVDSKTDKIHWADSIGTWNYCAPELICSYKVYETSIVWTLGLLLAYMIHAFPLDSQRSSMSRKQLASRRHWKTLYDNLRNEYTEHLPLPSEHAHKMSKQLQYIFERCTKWEPSERITLYELYSMLHLMQKKDRLPPTLHLHTISWVADPTHIPPQKRTLAIQIAHDLCQHFEKMNVLVRIISWIDRLELIDISTNVIVACFCLAWMLQGEYVLNDEHVLTDLRVLFEDFDLETLMADILHIGKSLSWRLWEKTADVYFAEQNRRDVIPKLYQVLKEIDKPYTMYQLATTI